MQNQKTTPQGSGDNRRAFIKKSATAAAAAATVSSLKTPVYGQNQAPSAGVIGANDRINVAVIGVGGQGFNAHVKPLVNNGQENNVRVLSTCDVSATRRTEAAAWVNENQSGGGCKAIANHEDVVANKDLDAVFIATVDHWHAPISIDAMNAGQHVYVEKPMTRYLGEAFEIYDTAKRTGKKVQVGAQRTSSGAYHKAAEIIRAGGIGPLVLSQGSYMRNAPGGEWNYYELYPWVTPQDIDWNRWLGRVRKHEFDARHYRRWRKFYPYCGGVLGDLLPHRLHPLMLATGNPEFPSRVVSLGNRKFETDKNTPEAYMRSVDELVTMVIEFPSGHNMMLTSATVNEQGLEEMIRGHHATIYIGNGRMELKPERPFSDEIDPESYSGIEPGEGVPIHHKNFFDALRTGTEPSANIDLAIKVQTIVSLSEISDRLNIMCLFDEKTRKITTQDGREVSPIDYDNDHLG